MKNETQLTIPIRENVQLIAEVDIIEDSETAFTCKIINANIVLTNGDIEEDITHQYTTDFIETVVQLHYEGISSRQKITVIPQKVGDFTKVLRIIVDKHGYFMEVFNMDSEKQTMQKSPIGTFAQVKKSKVIQKNLSGYYKGGARFIYRDNTHPRNDVFYKDDQQ